MVILFGMFVTQEKEDKGEWGERLILHSRSLSVAGLGTRSISSPSP